MKQSFMRIGVFLAVFAISLAAVCIDSRQSVGAEMRASCDSGFGTKVPVLMVHGLHGRPTDWGESKPSMIEAVQRIEGVQVVRAFDYERHNTEWVTHSAIGPALAERIDCLAQTSRREGGPGKVVVVAVSMGGLAARDAANRLVDGRQVANSLGLVVTIGTPHLGSGYGTICQYLYLVVGKCSGSAPKALATGSAELKALPPFPASVPVRAIAARVTVTTNLVFALLQQDLGGDKVVGVDSATQLATNTGKGDGVRVYECQGSSVFPIGEAPCEHARLPQAPYVQEGVVQGIEEYIASTRKVEHTYQGLTLHMDASWQGVDEGWAYELTYPSLCQEQCSALRLYASWPEWSEAQKLDYPPCSIMDASDAGELIEKGTRAVGGKTARYFERTLCDSSVRQETLRYWLLDDATDPLITVTDVEGYELPGVDETLAAASWQ